MSVTFDTSEVRALAARLGAVPRRMVPELVIVGDKAAAGIQRDLRSVARGHAHFPAFPASITTDRRGLDWEIGADKRRGVGQLANILYFGTSKTGPVLESPAAALDRAAPKLQQEIGLAGLRLLDGVL